jgi:WD40 repeat protein
MPGLAARLSRALVACYPRRWRQRYARELLAVLDQHQPSARTVLNLAAGAASTHLDPAWRAHRPGLPLLRTTALTCGAFVLVLGAPFAWWVHAQNWKDSHWHIGIEGSVNAMAFGPGQHILLTGTSGSMDGTDTLWNMASPAGPRRLAVLEGGAPATLSPDGRTVATVSFADQPQLWNVTRPRHPARFVQLRTGDHRVLWGEAFSPDGRVLATAFTDRIYLWDLTRPARPRLLRVLAAPVVPPSPAACGQPCQAPNPFYQGDIAFSPDGHLLAATAGRNQVAVWNVTDPARATRIAAFAGPSGFIQAVAFAPASDLLADVGTRGTVTLFDISAAGPVRVATMKTLPAARLAVDFCGPGCGPAGNFALGFAPDGRTLTAVVNFSSVAGTSGPQSPTWSVRDYVFTWNVTRPRSVTRVAAFSHPAPTPDGGGNGGQPMLAPDGRTVVDGAPFGSFGITLWQLP